MKTRYSLLLALPLAFAACAGDEEPEGDALDLETAGAPAATEPMQGDMGQAQGMATTVTMEGVGDSGVSGEAILTPAGGQSEVTVTLSGLEPNATHAGHIHQGTCAAPGSVVVPLSEVTADASGSGTMTTTAAIAADSATAGQHVVVYHGEGGTPIVCGEILHRM